MGAGRMTDGDGVIVRTVLDTGARKAGPTDQGLRRRLVDVSAGARFEGNAGPGGELWFVLTGTGRMTPGSGPQLTVGPDTGLWLPPGTAYSLQGGNRACSGWTASGCPPDPVAAELPRRGG